AAGRPAGGERRRQRLGAWKEVVLANLVNAVRHAVPRIGVPRQRLHHELVPDGGGADDAGGVVRQRVVVGIAHPYRRRQARREANGPVVAEVLGGPGLGRHVTSGKGQVAAATGLDRKSVVLGKSVDLGGRR